MQSISPLTSTDLLGPVQQMLYKLEVWDGVWIDINEIVETGPFYGDPYYGEAFYGGTISLLKSVSLKLGGAGASPDPVAGSWSAEVQNPGGIFHPFHPTSSYKALLRVGRKVRISVGAKYAGTPYYWQRLIGYMGAPAFNHEAKTVSLKGADFMKRLADFKLRSPGNFWGNSATYSTIASVMILGSEIYNEADALEIEHEAGNLTSWVEDKGSFSVMSDSGLGSIYVGYLSPDNWYEESSTHDDNVGSFTAGKNYKVTFKYQRVSGWMLGAKLSCYIYKTGTTYAPWGSIANLGGNAVTEASFQFTCPETATARMAFKLGGGYKAGVIGVKVDLVSIKEITGDAYNAPYELPGDSNGPYLAVLDGVEIWFGQANDEWTFDEATNLLTFSEKKIIAAGTDNLIIYYFTTQTLENVVADILVAAGYYTDRAAALAAMDYTATGVTVGRTWFDTGTLGLGAIHMLCERANYRFWFAFDETPTFKPAPEAGSPVFTFSSPAHVKDPGVHQDLTEIRNRIVIEGIERAMYAAREDKKTSRFTGAAFNQNSIDAYLEKTHSITNHLFQDQESIDAMAAALLAAFKDPKWYTEIKTPFNPVPLEFGDTIAWPVELAVASAPGGEPVIVNLAGIIRDIDIGGGEIVYACQITTA